jgi:hypothetical protein
MKRTLLLTFSLLISLTVISSVFFINDLNHQKKELDVFSWKNMTMAELIIYKYSNTLKRVSLLENGGAEKAQIQDLKTQPNDILILIFTGQTLKDID